MISSIQVNGYRSLQAFALDFQSGLNVLVGPNAAGKSNIVSFFYFLRLIVENPLSEAVALAGGAASVFTKVGTTEYQRSLRASVMGIIPREKRHYRYTFTIELTSTKNQIFFSSQELAIGKIGAHGFESDRVIGADVTVTSDERLSITPLTKGFPRRRKHQHPIGLELDHLLKNYHRPDQSLLALVRLFPFYDLFDQISADFLGTAIFNVIPSAVKAPEDTVRTPGISPDGAGIAASLHALRIGAFSTTPRLLRDIHTPIFGSEPANAKLVIQRIIETVQVAVPLIQGIVVKSDPFDAQLTCNVEFAGGDNCPPITLPLAQVSDGTAKWISVITALYTSTSGISLEEPENFLHPHMQREIVRLMRDNCGQDSFVLLTTHSETVLNAVTPHEVIVVNYENGRTVASRPSNAELIEKQINETGFGLGFYYLANAIET
jgi:predicted ATPase